MRGGNAGGAAKAASPVGASPRARGKLYRRPSPCGTPGCIPACAGETFAAWSMLPSVWVHPRVRGGNDLAFELKIFAVGASPRARGKLIHDSFKLGNDGCIPACAGETCKGSRCRGYRGVHPRVRGGNLPAGVVGKKFPGASPRARGKPVHPRDARHDHGCIPACAGETYECVQSVGEVGVHPRVRGGNREFRSRWTNVVGASPRARGKL